LINEGGENEKMEISKRKFLVAVSLIAVLTFLGGYSIAQVSLKNHRDPTLRENVYIFKETPSGTELIGSGNVISDIGERYIRNILGFDNVTANNATKWISLGNSSVADTKTKLDTEATTTGFTRTLGTVTAWMNGTDYAYNVTKKFRATGDIQINCAGLQWSGTSDSDNNLFALASLGGAQDFENNWNCTIVWVITWDAND